ncbi:MAG: 3-keto-5-aminohexanoate cleavage protein [Streptosporangiaceae bacterium]
MPTEHRPILVHAALNGAREHPATPRTPGELAAETRAAVDAGARSLHLHPHDSNGRETFAAEPCAAALSAVRTACPDIPVSLSTSADVEPDPERRFALPDLVTANQGEEGIVALCEALIARGVGIASWAVNRRALPRGHGIRTGWKTHRCCPTGASRQATANSSRPRRDS